MYIRYGYKKNMGISKKNCSKLAGIGGGHEVDRCQLRCLTIKQKKKKMNFRVQTKNWYDLCTIFCQHVKINLELFNFSQRGGDWERHKTAKVHIRSYR